MVKPIIPVVQPPRGILKVRGTYINQEDSAINAQCLNKKPNLQNCFANKVDYEMNNTVEEASLHNLERIDRHAILKDILGCKLAKGDLVSPHVEKMIGLFEKLEKLGSGINQEVAIDIILSSLPDEYAPYIPTFLKCDLENTMYKLYEMLKNVEIHLKKINHAHPLILVPKKECIKEQAKKNRGVNVESNMGKMKVCSKSSSLVVQDKKASKKKNNKSNNTKAVNQCEVKTVAPKGPKVEDKCHYCNVNGHWKRNCKKYFEDRKNSIVATQSTGIYVIEAFLSLIIVIF
ncbi:hypothetical protein LIER_05343 [Lithospermum erythrorhizon]|uniref:Polyprotein n=1 Tax=Lithospermum erythrorhizon TaxID=34254 RepID=A0AAV3P1T3_LITER